MTKNKGGSGKGRSRDYGAKKRSTFEIVRRVSVFLMPYKWMALGTIGCAVVSLGFAFVYPQLTSYIIDEVITNQRMEELPWVVGGLIGAFFFRELFNSFRIIINNHNKWVNSIW